MKSFFNEFKEFISRGNVLDMAVGVVIGGAFTAIVTSLVDNIITPIVGMLCGGVDISGLTVQVGDAALGYGAFLQAIVNFLIISFVIFCFVKSFNAMKDKALKAKKAEEEKVEEAAEDPQITLLKEIRDLLEKQNAAK